MLCGKTMFIDVGLYHTLAIGIVNVIPPVPPTTCILYMYIISNPDRGHLSEKECCGYCWALLSNWLVEYNFRSQVNWYMCVCTCICHVILPSRHDWTSDAQLLRSCTALVRSVSVSPVHIRMLSILYSKPSVTSIALNKTCHQLPSILFPGCLIMSWK